ncbi:hypothetical protein D3C81_2132480 [compost metagenome]|jgi:hypothetical protein|nr:hypothetical protein [Citrobacter sp. JUb117]
MPIRLRMKIAEQGSKAAGFRELLRKGPDEQRHPASHIDISAVSGAGELHG